MSVFHILQELVRYYIFKYFSQLFDFQLYNTSDNAKIIVNFTNEHLYLLNFMAFLARLSLPSYKE